MNPQQNTQKNSQKNTETWENLKQVITDSTGFEKWKRSRLVETNTNDQKLLDPRLVDELVTSYLRETLETLAY
jgi:hypothetical protein